MTNVMNAMQTSNSIPVCIVRDQQQRTTVYEPLFWETILHISDETKADYTAKIAAHTGIPADLIHNLCVCQAPEWMGAAPYAVCWVPTRYLRQRDIEDKAVRFYPGKVIWCSGYPMQRVEFEVSSLTWLRV